MANYDYKKGEWYTNDGKTFDTLQQAQAHENKSGSQTSGGRQYDFSPSESTVIKMDPVEFSQQIATRKAQDERSVSEYNSLAKAFNAGDWDAVISINAEGGNNRENVDVIKSVAYSMKGDYRTAYELIWNTKYEIAIHYDGEVSNFAGFDRIPQAYSAAKMAWERVNGRAMTAADIRNIRVAYLEKLIDKQNRILGSIEKEGDQFAASKSLRIKEHKLLLKRDTQEWERITGQSYKGKSFDPQSDTGKKGGLFSKKADLSRLERYLVSTPPPQAAPAPKPQAAAPSAAKQLSAEELADEHNVQGIAFFNKDDWNNSIKEFAEAHKLDPDNAVIQKNLAEAYNNRGNTFSADGKWDEAISDYAEAVRLDPNGKVKKQNLAGTYNCRGVAFFKKNEFKKAAADFAEAVRLDPQDEIKINNLTAAKAQLKEKRKK